MTLPLQPDLRPPPPWLGRVITLLALMLAVLIIGWCQQARSSPPRLLTSDGGEQNFVTTLEQRIDQAHTQVWLMLFVLRPEQDGQGPVSRLVQALARAKARGVDVRVVLDQSRRWQSDEIEEKHLIAGEWLTRLGVPVLIDSLERRTHAKSLVIDGRWVVVGSHNWTYSALARNVELSILVEDRALARAVQAVFAETPGWDELSLP